MNLEIAKRLADLRKQNGLSQEQLAEKIGVSRQAVSKWERSEASPDTDNIILLARLYNVSLDELLRTEDDVPVNEAYEQEKEASANESVQEEPGQEQQPEQPEASGFEGSTEETSENTAEGAENSSAYDENYYNYGDSEDKVHIGLDGIHVSSKNGDEVHVGWGGIHVNEHRGDKVDIDHRGIHVNEHGGDTVSVDGNGVFVNGEKKDIGECIKTNGRIIAATVFLACISFTCLGIFCDGWAWSWLVFLLIPVVTGVIKTFRKGDIRKMETPSIFLCTFLFLFIGITMNYWWWCWLILLLIPIFLTLIDAAHKKRPDHFAYPVLVTLVFLAGGMFYGMWHPLWTIYFTVPLYYWICSLIRNAKN
ncbi:MAG: helix-turn-helix domain-containing protein [Ruminiclostridium sp.]